MGFRFQKRLRIFRGLTVNLSKSGASWSLGRPGATVNLRRGRLTGNVGIPGTGMSYRQRLLEASGSGWGKRFLAIILIGSILAIVWLA